MTTAPPPKKSDLGVRTASAVVMIAVAGSALWLGGYWWTAFVAAVALGVLWEWFQLVAKFSRNRAALMVWAVFGVAYIGIAALALEVLRNTYPEINLAGGIVALPICGVILTDVGAYFAGRTIGGPKIAPSISPSKTWSGLFGGMIAAALFLGWVASWSWDVESMPASGRDVAIGAVAGVLLAIIAQAGDFYESWMKRRAGVKDSGKLIPGHGGLFDRVDGLLAVSFVLGLLLTASFLAVKIHGPVVEDPSIKLHR